MIEPYVNGESFMISYERYELKFKEGGSAKQILLKYRYQRSGYVVLNI